MFESQLEQPPIPSSDVFNYVFHHGRRAYPWSKVLYRMDGTDETLTLAQLEEQSRQLGMALKNKYDIEPNDAISIYAKNRIQFPVAFFGVLAAGATVALVPMQDGMTATDIASRLIQAKSKLLITDSSLLKLSECASSLAGCVRIVSMDQADALTPNMATLIAQSRADLAAFELTTPEGSADNDAIINRTSGSTGAMKSVLTTHRHYIATLEGTARTVPPDTDPAVDTWLASSSLGFFINAKLFLSLNILLGVPVVIMPEAMDETSTSAIARHNITFLLVFPPLVSKLAKSDLRPEQVGSLKWLLSAGASIPDNLRLALGQKVPGVGLTLEWGASETMLIAIQTTDPATRKSGSSGTLVNGMQARVISTLTGEDLGPNECGEILVRNKLAPFKGYKDNEAANRDFDVDGWFHMGDFGYLDAACNVYIIDRLKELLRVGDGYGSRINVTELEDAIFDHPAIHSMVVAGVWDEASATALPTAFVVPTPAYRPWVGYSLTLDIEHHAANVLTYLLVSLALLSHSFTPAAYCYNP
ncbi:AMP-binding enzyme domain protein [Penicillium longicatenatum]|uniref:AMP-binding enzyme domain protein n=1 Tax=Penicillium longicatenatum TaxID=1561947 RepID=UPI002547FEF4|nr:AMP-binding enzyme domain protein [Penicillium longicatenatum]KAJ5660837.1 AMP-binding enzyme domain protein [Penicillium longicatenatum]